MMTKFKTFQNKALHFILMLNDLLNSESQKTKKIESAFKNRISLSEDDFHNNYFSKEGIPQKVTVNVRRILEEHLDADLSRLNKDDDFSENLNFFWDFDSMADVEIVCALEEEFLINITDEEAMRLKTVNNIVQMVWQKLSVDRRLA